MVRTVGATHVVAGIDIQVSIHVSLMSTPNRTSHTRPRLLDGQYTLYIVAMDLFARDRVDDGGLDSEKG